MVNWPRNHQWRFKWVLCAGRDSPISGGSLLCWWRGPASLVVLPPYCPQRESTLGPGFGHENPSREMGSSSQGLRLRPKRQNRSSPRCPLPKDESLALHQLRAYTPGDPGCLCRTPWHGEEGGKPGIRADPLLPKPARPRNIFLGGWQQNHIFGKAKEGFCNNSFSQAGWGKLGGRRFWPAGSRMCGSG